jgi:uncharacterized membrane protein YfcA
MMVLGLGLAALVGLSLGLLGGGGSILTVPILVYVLGYGAKEAIAMSLAVVGTTSLVGAAGHWRAGNVKLRVALLFGAVAMAGSFLGSRLSAYFTDTAQLALFALVMLLAAGFMFRGRREAAGAAGGERIPFALIALSGVAVGVLTGLVGVGGGFLIVPALVLLGRVPMKEAVGTSLLIIAMNSATGFAGYLGRVEVAWTFMALFTAVAVAGILVGTRLVRYVPQGALRRGFALFLVCMGAFVLYQNRSVVLPTAAASAAAPAVHGSLND